MNRKKILGMALTYLIVAGVYLAFFSYPVVPAQASAENYHLQKEETIYRAPYAVSRTYIRESSQPAILIVATVRTPFLPSHTYSSTMFMVKKMIEDDVKEEYGVDIEVVFQKEFETSIGGHETVMQDYDIHLKYLDGIPLGIRPDTLKMDIGAYFCNEKYESVVVAYVYPPLYSGDFDAVMASISC